MMKQMQSFYRSLSESLWTDDPKLEQEHFDELHASALVDGKLIFAGSLLQRAAQRYGDQTALIYNEITISFTDLYRRASHMSHLLQSRGIKPRNRVFIIFENSIDFYIAYYGAWQTGAIVAPLNTFLHEKELRHIVEDAQPTALIASTKFAQPFQGLVSIVLTEQDMKATHEIPASQAEFPVYHLEPDELAILLYTSGTTGFPKGVMLSSKNIMTSLAQGIARLKMGAEKRVLAVLPLFHSFAQNTCVWAPLFVGATTIIVPKIERRYILEGLRHKPHVFLGVPALYGLLCLLKTAPVDSVDYFISGGDALPDKIRGAFELVYHRKICNGYGLTETCPVISVEMEDMLLPTNCVGRPLLGVMCSIQDEQGNEVRQGEIGTLWVKGDNVMLGYYNAPDTTREVLKDGWLKTGDLATFDAQGRLYICGRSKDLIIHKGFNIYPQEIENIIMTHPSVIMVGVVGKKETDLGEVPVAFVALRSPVPAIVSGIEQELRTLCMNNMASYKIPRQFIILEKLPLTATGKVDKKKLKAEYLSS